MKGNNMPTLEIKSHEKEPRRKCICRFVAGQKILGARTKEITQLEDKEKSKQ